MKKKFIEEKVKTAVDNVTPDVLEQIKLETNGKEQAAPVAAKRRLQKKIPLARRLAVGFMCIAVLICGGIGLYGYNQNHAVASQIFFDVNPSVTMTLNRNERVLNVKANNADAERVLAGLDFSGSSYDVAVNAIIGAMLRTGYLSELSNSLLVSVNDGNAERCKVIEGRLLNEIDKVFASENFDGAIIAQSISDDSALKSLAEEYGITMGKSKLINHILDALEYSKANDGGAAKSYTFKDFVGLTINELNVLAQSLDLKTDEIFSSGTASKENYIGIDEAVAAAIGFADVAESDLSVSPRIKTDCEHGLIVYEVSFGDDLYEYECKVNALTGECVKLSKEIIDEPAIAGEIKTETEIAEIAKEATGIDAQSEISDYRSEYDREDGKYEISFVSGGFRYEVEILADGAVISIEKEAAKPSVDVDNENRKSQEEAKKTALFMAVAKAARLGIEINESLIIDFESELECENGVWIYKIEFRCSGFEFEYRINAVTGAVIKENVDMN